MHTAQIKNIIFDVSEVLTKHVQGPEWSNRLLAEEYGVPFGKIQAFFNEFGRVGGKIHGMSIEEFWKIKTTSIDPIPLSGAIVCAKRYEEDIVVDEKMVELIKNLQNSYRLFALTNCWKPGHAFKKELEEYFESFVQSCDINLRKPDPTVYQYMCDTYNLKSTNTLFIDNKSENTEAAKKYGMHSIQFIDITKFKKELRKLLITD